MTDAAVTINPLEWSEEGRIPLFAAYAKAQASMGSVTKDAKNDHFKTQYATLAGALGAVMPAMNANGLAVIQSPTFDGECLTVETIVTHAEGGWMRSSLNVRPGKPDAQGLGSAITYLRRYALMALAGVAPEDDDGNAASVTGEGGKRFERNKPPEPKQPLAVVAAQTAINVCEDRAQLKAWLAANESMIKALPPEQHDDIARFYKTRWAALATQIRAPDPTLEADSAPKLNGVSHAMTGDANDPFRDEIPF